ncbi:MAG: hypothetical protein ACFB16_04210 [Phormidesmis sp.]
MAKDGQSRWSVQMANLDNQSLDEKTGASDPSGKRLNVRGPIRTSCQLALLITDLILTGITPPGGNAHHSPSLQNESLY